MFVSLALVTIVIVIVSGDTYNQISESPIRSLCPCLCALLLALSLIVAMVTVGWFLLMAKYDTNSVFCLYHLINNSWLLLLNIQNKAPLKRYTDEKRGQLSFF
eukprot:1008362_1